MVVNMRIIGAALGTIMATIITAHMTNNSTRSVTPQVCMWGIAIFIQSMLQARYPV
jgi:hypothetical protein